MSYFCTNILHQLAKQRTLSFMKMLFHLLYHLEQQPNALSDPFNYDHIVIVSC